MSKEMNKSPIYPEAENFKFSFFLDKFLYIQCDVLLIENRKLYLGAKNERKRKKKKITSMTKVSTRNIFPFRKFYMPLTNSLKSVILTDNIFKDWIKMKKKKQKSNSPISKFATSSYFCFFTFSWEFYLLDEINFPYHINWLNSYYGFLFAFSKKRKRIKTTKKKHIQTSEYFASHTHTPYIKREEEHFGSIILHEGEIVFINYRKCIWHQKWNLHCSVQSSHNINDFISFLVI